MAYNYSKLNGRIVEVFETQANFAEAMGVSEHSISKKLNNKSKFRQFEIDKACELLSIPHEEIGLYFFNRNVHVS